MVFTNADRETIMTWMRRIAFYIASATGVTATVIGLFGAVLVASGVLEW